MITISDLKKTYNINKANEFEALHNIKLSIDKGEMVAIIGTSGAGKSTLLHIISCLDTFEQGTYILDGEDLSKVNAAKSAEVRNKKIGMVMQDFALVEEFSVIDNVCIPLYFSKKRKKTKEQKKMALEALNKVGIEELAGKIVNQLSGGQRQRVAIARAIVNEPSIILADEPTGALDSKTTDSILNVFKELNEQGKTVIIVTHDEGVANACKRVITIGDGLIVSDVKNE